MKGIFYSIMVSLLVIPIIYLVVFYSSSTSQQVGMSVRSDELRYASYSVEQGLKEFFEIQGRRALVSASNTSGINANSLAEMIVDGTLNGEPASLVSENTLTAWIRNTTDIYSRSGFNLSLESVNVGVYQYDSSDILVNATALMNVSDSYSEAGISKEIEVQALVPLDGIENPLAS